MGKHMKKARKVAQKLAKPAAILGGIAAAGLVAAKLWRRSSDLPHENGPPRFTDADRAIDFEPAGDLDHPRRHDVVGDPSVRTSVGLAIPGEQ